MKTKLVLTAGSKMSIILNIGLLISAFTWEMRITTSRFTTWSARVEIIQSKDILHLHLEYDAVKMDLGIRNIFVSNQHASLMTGMNIRISSCNHLRFDQECWKESATFERRFGNGHEIHSEIFGQNVRYYPFIGSHLDRDFPVGNSTVLGVPMDMLLQIYLIYSIESSWLLHRKVITFIILPRPLKTKI